MNLFNSIFSKQPSTRFEILESNIDTISSINEYVRVVLVNDELDFRMDGRTLKTILASNIQTIEILKGNSIERLTKPKYLKAKRH
jgi:stage III sporulation protein SpoIIIAA